MKARQKSLALALVKRQAAAELLSLGDVATLFWEVSRCWHDSLRAARENMTVERALSTLRVVRQQSFGMNGGMRLSIRANTLLNEIVRSQKDVEAVEVGAL